MRFPGPFIFALLGLALLSCSTSESLSPPNIILIMADDLGYSDLGIHGNTLVETPNLDQFAGESVQFSQFYVTPVCASTRASLLTGRHFLRTGVSHVHGGKDFLHLDEVTIADRLREKGYATGMWGKWHSGKTPGYFPWERGFDEAFMARLYRYRDNTGLLNGEQHTTEGWLPGVLTDMALDFIHRNRGGPFFAYLPYLTCHSGLDAPESYISKYESKGLSRNLSTLYGMIEHLDHHLGRLFSALEEWGLSENTLVVFLSDNGPAIINNLLTDEDREIRYMNGLRGHKGNIWENGIRSPLFVRWAGQTKPSMVEHLAGVSDLFPTFLELAGADTSGSGLDGRSLVPYLKGRKEALEGKEIFLYASPGWPPTDKPWTPEGTHDEYRPWKYGNGSNLSFENQIIGIRNENYKLLLNPGYTDGSIDRDPEGYVLLDIRNDPMEQQNIAGLKPDVFMQMKEKLHAAYKDIYGSKHAFEMPVFLVGSLGDHSYPVLAYGPRRSSPGARSASNYITGFSSPDDWAEYDILVKQGGTYTFEVHYSLENTESIDLTLEVQGKEYSLKLTAGEGLVQKIPIEMSEGFTTFRVTNLTSSPDADIRLREFTFTRTDL
jgi:arylsulfatase A-like enzyme